MEFNRAGQVKSLDQIRIDRRRNGFCESCRIDPVRCFETRKGIFGTKKEPLTIPGRVYHGICLNCHPHMAPDYTRQSETSESYEIGDSGRRAEYVRQGATRNLWPTQPQNKHIRTGYGGRRDYDDDDNNQEDKEMIEEEITNVMGETLTVLKPRKKKKKDRVKRHGNKMLDLHEESEQEFELQQAQHAQLTFRSSSYAERELAKDDDEMDELERMVAQHFATTQEAPKFDPQSFVQGAELPIYEMEDEPSVLTLPTVFADDGTVVSRSTRSVRASSRKTKENENSMSAIHERTTANSGSHSGSHRSVASHELHEPTVPKQSEEIYLQSADTLSPDIDAVRDIVRDCMQMGSDEQAIEIARQALMDTESLDLALFCLTTLWVLVRKSDENKRHVLYGSKNEATRDDETPFGAIINAMVVFESAEIQTRACGVIWSLSMNPDDRKDVAQLGGCQAILQAMLVHPDNEALQVMALGALKVLSFNVVGQSSLRQISASSVVVASMAKHIINPIIQSEGCAIICNLASGPHNFIIPVTEEEVDAIVNSIMSHPESPSIQEGAIFALMSLSSSTVNVEIMRQHPNLYEALDLSFSNHPDVVGRDIQVLLENLKAEKPR